MTIKRTLLMANLVFLFSLTFGTGGILSANDKENKIKTAFNYKDQSEKFWKTHLSLEVYKVCRAYETEKPGSGKYNKFYEKGTYYCACCGGDHAIYSSEAKFDSGTGWPSFSEAIKGGVTERRDPNDSLRGLVGLARTEVICSRCHSHLGHVFNDGPLPTGKRYCMNSITLSFTPEGKQLRRTYSVTPVLPVERKK